MLDNATGEWLAWEGSGDYFGDRSTASRHGGAIDGVTTPAAARLDAEAVHLRAGVRERPLAGDRAARRAVAFSDRRGRHRLHAAQLRRPLSRSAACSRRAGRIGERSGRGAAVASSVAESLLRLLRNAGFSGLDRTADYYGLGLTLGDAEVTLDQLVTAYATFARGGRIVQSTKVRRELSAVDQQLLSRRTAFWITDILSDSGAREYAFGSGGSLDFPFPVAVKTGTSQAYRDNWTSATRAT